MHKDDLVETFDIYFEGAYVKMDFLYHELDLIPMDMFKVFRGGQFVDVSHGPQPSPLIAFLAKDTQAKPEGDKATEDAKLVATSPGDAPREKFASKESQ